MSPEVSVHELTSDEALVNEATRLADNETDAMIMARQMEMSRRLSLAIRAFNRSADRWSRVLFFSGLVLLAATLVLALLTIDLLATSCAQIAA